MSALTFSRRSYDSYLVTNAGIYVGFVRRVAMDVGTADVWLADPRGSDILPSTFPTRLAAGQACVKACQGRPDVSRVFRTVVSR